jgi:RNA polymerase sigma-70 factor (ECF subfamily)
MAGGTSPSRHLLREEMRDRVRGALAALGERDREALVLRFLEGLSTAEAAVVLGVSEGAVKSRVMRALARFRDLLDDREEDRR